MNRVVIGVGSNIDPEKNIEQAKQQISQDHNLITASKIIETKPLGYTDQPNFLNGAFLVETNMDYTTFNTYLHTVETKLKRIRTKNKFGPRTIDLDIAVWNDKIVDDDVYERDFLKKAVLEVYPELNHII